MERVYAKRLVGCLLLPNLPLQVERPRGGRPVGPLVVASPGPGRRRVIEVSETGVGVEVGMLLSEALAIAPGVRVATADADRISQLSELLADGLGGISALVEVAADRCGVLYFDAGVVSDDRRMVSDLTLSVMGLVPDGLVARLGLGAGRFPALCAARWAPDGGAYLAPVDVGSWSSEWPATVLLDEASARRATAAGVLTLGAVAGLTPEQAAQLFGADGERYRALAVGRDDGALRGREGLPEMSESLDLPYAVDTHSGLSAAVEVLCGRLWRGRAGGLSAGYARLNGQLDDGASWSYVRRFGRRPSDGAGLHRMLMSGLASQSSGGESHWPTGPLCDLSLVVGDLGAVGSMQLSMLADGSRAPGRLVGEGIDRLVPFEPWSVLPERRWARESDLTLSNAPRGCEVRTSSGMPVSVLRRGCWRDVIRVLDLWEVEADWWSPRPEHRRYFRVMSSVGTFTLFHDLLGGCWYLQEG